MQFQIHILKKIKSWDENGSSKNPSFPASNNELVEWLRSQKTDVILISENLSGSRWENITRKLYKDELKVSTPQILAFN